MNKPSSDQTPNPAWPGLLTGAGTLLLLLGFAWPKVADPRSSWTEEKAQQYTQASADLHQAAHAESHNDAPNRDNAGHDHADHGHADLAHQHELEAARQRFEQLKQELEESKNRPHNVAYVIKLVGGFFVVLGAIALLIQKAGH